MPTAIRKIERMVICSPDRTKMADLAAAMARKVHAKRAHSMRSVARARSGAARGKHPRELRARNDQKRNASVPLLRRPDMLHAVSHVVQREAWFCPRNWITFLEDDVWFSGTGTMPIMTGLSGNEMYCLDLKGFSPGELVIGNGVHSLGFIGSIGASLQNVFGGEVSQITNIISEGRHESEARLIAEAQKQGAHGITGVTSEVRHMQGNVEFRLVKRIYGRLSAPVAFRGHDTTQFP
jgi:uncharacterized protein YbjQ (UPF0145 family)